VCVNVGSLLNSDFWRRWQVLPRWSVVWGRQKGGKATCNGPSGLTNCY